MKDALDNIHDYCETHTTPPSSILHELERETHLKTLAPQMLSGHLQGQFLAMLSRIQQPRLVLEIGTFTGYAAICLAQGLQKGGTLHTIEANPELEYLIRKYIAQAGLDDNIQLHIGDALEIIPGLAGPFDMVFIDANKQEYIRYYDLVIDKVAPGGLILSDNVLWSGKVLTAAEREKDEDAALIHQFNEKVLRDERVENVMLPLRDGLLIARKV